MAPKRGRSRNSFTLNNKTQTVKLVIQEESPPPQPAEYAVLQSKLRTNQRRLRQLEATLADVFSGEGISAPLLSKRASVSSMANVNAIGNKAETLARFRQESRTFQDNVKRAELLGRQLEMLATQERMLRQSVMNTETRIRSLKANNTRRILAERARGNQANEVIIRQEHNAAVQLLRAEALGIREKLRAVLEQKNLVNADFQQASEAAARLENRARQAQLKASQTAQDIMSLRSRSVTSTRQKKPKRITRPPTRRRS